MRIGILPLLLTLGMGVYRPCASAWAWQVNIDGAAHLGDQVHAVTVDPNGDVVAAGTTQNNGTSSDFTVAKLSGATGATIWRRVVAGSATVPSGEARAITLDAAGNVIAAGFISNVNALQDFAIVKLAGADGTEMWRRVVDGTASMNDLARSIRLDPSGDVVAAGEVQNTATGKDFIIVKLSAMTGAPLWQRQINGSANLDDFARSVRVDSAGDVLVGGDLRNTGSSDFAVLKLAGLTGAEMWRRVIDGTAQGNDLVRTMRVDTVGDVVAAGELQNIGTGRDFAVVKLSGVTGAEVWRRQIDGSASVDDLARSVRVDAAGDVIAAGELQNTGTGIDFAVVKLSGSTGTEIWRRLINGTASGNDAAHAVRVDSSGDILACGAVQNSGTDLDFTVVKLSPADGSQIWHREINGRASGPDQATALAEDSSGDVVAAGFTQNPATNMDFAVIKLRGSDGSDFMPQGTTTTTTTLPPATCFTIPECELALAAALPAVQGATGKTAKRVARQLNRLDHKLNRILDHALVAPGKKRPRLYRRARAILGHTLAGAQAAGSHGILGVALGPIQTAISGLLALTAP